MASRFGQRDEGYRPYLLDTETVVFAIHRHWAILARPAGIFAGSVLLTVLLLAHAPGSLTRIFELMIWVTLGTLAYLGWQVLEWRREFFVATDKRLLLTQGIIERDTAMMPLGKVTDLKYIRSIPGRLLGFGTFVFENAGQDQAMREVHYVPEPDTTYRLLVANIFQIPSDQADRDHRLEPDPHAGATDPGMPPGPGPRPASPEASGPAPHLGADEVDDPAPEHSRAIPVVPHHEPVIEQPRRRRPETLFQSADIRARKRTADTGPLAYYSGDEPRFDPTGHDPAPRQHITPPPVEPDPDDD